MSRYSLNDETSIDVLIFWMESADGSIPFKEEETVKKLLNTMSYDLRTFHETISHIGAMSVEHIEEVVQDAIGHIKSSFSDDAKKMVLNLLVAIAACDGNINPEEQKKIDQLKEQFGI